MTLRRVRDRAVQRYDRRTRYLFPEHDARACAEAIRLVFRLERRLAHGQMDLDL